MKVMLMELKNPLMIYWGLTPHLNVRKKQKTTLIVNDLKNTRTTASPKPGDKGGLSNLAAVVRVAYSEVLPQPKEKANVV